MPRLHSKTGHGEPAPGGMQASFWPLRQTHALGSRLKAVFALEAFHRAGSGAGSRLADEAFLARSAYGAEQRPGRNTTLNKETDP
ncbi:MULTISPECIES: hypothetical protein [Delftia]|uniref:hypothetical protein n=1 Tax=Delftia TaxID=80865 RepID=UPI0006407BDC|nr:MULTISPECIES: hypothetical protein [Delftia]MCX7506492.1 hypothetical protein [Delftia tsuruhatensis]